MVLDSINKSYQRWPHVTAPTLPELLGKGSSLGLYQPFNCTDTYDYPVGPVSHMINTLLKLSFVGLL